MNWRVVLTDRANAEFLDSMLYYDEVSFKVSEKFIQQILKSLELIQKKPESFPVQKKDIRQYIVQEFPYLILFSLHTSSHDILFHSIFHTSRNPTKKYKKR
jgi:plasmid stabilization system protein ParE